MGMSNLLPDTGAGDVKHSTGKRVTVPVATWWHTSSDERANGDARLRSRLGVAVPPREPRRYLAHDSNDSCGSTARRRPGNRFPLRSGVWIHRGRSRKLSPRAAYAQGKALTFKELVCDGCPLQKNELDADRARSLAASLEAAYDGEKAGTPDDDAVQALCGEGVEDCKLRMETVHYFLSRRYRL